MKAYEIMEALKAESTHVHDNLHVDTLKAGCKDKEVRKIATCFIATPDVIREAAAWGADLLITHEPTFYNHRDFNGEIPDDPVMQAKKKLLESAGMTVYRYHDHAHDHEPDVISIGQVNALPWDCEFDGHFLLTLKTPMTAREMAADIEKCWGIARVRLTGDLDTPMTKIALLIGAYGDEKHYQYLRDTDCEVLIVGETNEWRIGEYVRDGAQMGFRRALLTCGHAGSEKAGMEYLVKHLEEKFDGIKAKYFECGEVYSYLK